MGQLVTSAALLLLALLFAASCDGTFEDGAVDNIVANQQPADVVTCDARLPVTIATFDMVVDAQSYKDPRYQVAMVTKLAEYLRIHPSALRQYSANARKARKLGSTLASGVGNCGKNIFESVQGFQHVLIEWTVGCGQVSVDYLTSLHQAEKLATAPRVTSLWHCIQDWQVASKRSKPVGVSLTTDRHRRAVRAANLDLEGSGYDSSGPLHLVQSPAQVTTTAVSAINTPPVVKNFLRLIVVRIGDVLNYTIPSDTFDDASDGDTRQLKLELREENGRPLPPKLWIKFDSRRQIIYALPKPEHEGRHAFLLRATDSDGNTAVERVRLRVMAQRKDQRDQRVPIEYSLALEADFWHFTSDVENMAWLVMRLATAAGDRTSTSVSLTRVQGGSVVVSWVNNTLPSNSCPVDDIRAVLDRFVSPLDGQISDNVAAALQPYKPLRFFTQPLAACLEDDVIAEELTVDTSHQESPDNGDTEEDEGDTNKGTDDVNSRPLVNRPIGTLHVTVGGILDYVIPEETFSDAEDGTTRQLRLIFLSLDNLTVSRNSWVRLNVTEQRLHGLPLTTPPGTYTYQLAAADSHGQFAHHRFDIVVRERDFEPNHEFTVVLKFDFAQFMADVTRQVDVARRLAQVYGDADASEVTVLGVVPGLHQPPSLSLTWCIRTLARQALCPARDISRLWSALVSKSSTAQDSKASEPLIKVLDPYEADRVELQVLGPCANEPIGLQQPNATTRAPAAVNSPSASADDVIGESDDVDGVVMQPSNGGHVMDTTAVAASVSALAIFVLIVLIVVIVIVVYFRRRQQHKYPVSEHKTAVKVKHGVPIIFADELEASVGYGGGERPPGTLPRGLSPSQVAVSGVGEGAEGVEVKVTAPVLPAPPDYPRWGRTSSGGVAMTSPSSSDHKTPLLAAGDASDTQVTTYDNMTSSFSSAN